MALDCDLVLPCRDEAAVLPTLLARVPTGLGVVVVDNGSRDGSAAVARALGARVVAEPRPGYGAAVHAGVVASTARWVAVMDADGSLDPADVLPLLDVVAQGGADLAAGRRRPVERGALPWHAQAGNAVVLWWLRRRTGVGVHDIAAMRVCGREALLALGIRDRRFGYPVELLVRAQAAGWRVHESDVSYRPRWPGTRSKVSGSVLGTCRTVHDFVRALP